MQDWEWTTQDTAVRCRVLTRLLVPPKGIGGDFSVPRATVQNSPGCSILLTAGVNPHAAQSQAGHLSSWRRTREFRKTSQGGM